MIKLLITMLIHRVFLLVDNQCEVVLSDQVWSSVIKCDQVRWPIWSKVCCDNQCDMVWSYLVICDQVWLSVINSDQLWSSVIKCDQVWSSVIKCNQVRSSVMTNLIKGWLWPSVWCYVVLSGHLWSSVIECDQLWLIVIKCDEQSDQRIAVTISVM